ncbi:MAG: hypothetical protein WCP79_10895 [Bacillota bacterium]
MKKTEKAVEYSRIINMLVSRDAVLTDNVLLSLICGLEYTDLNSKRYTDLVDRIIRRVKKDIQLLKPELKLKNVVFIGSNIQFSTVVAEKIACCNLTERLPGSFANVNFVVSSAKVDKTGFFNTNNCYCELSEHTAQTLFFDFSEIERQSVLTNISWLALKHKGLFFNHSRIIVAEKLSGCAARHPADIMVLTGRLTDHEEIVTNLREITVASSAAGNQPQHISIYLYSEPGCDFLQVNSICSEMMGQLVELNIQPLAFNVFEFTETNAVLGEKIYGNDVCLTADHCEQLSVVLEPDTIREWLNTPVEKLVEQRDACRQFLQELDSLSSFLLCTQTDVKYLDRSIYIRLSSIMNTRLSIAAIISGEHPSPRQYAQAYRQRSAVGSSQLPAAATVIKAIVAQSIPAYVDNQTTFIAAVRSINEHKADLFCEGIGEITVFFEQQPEVKNLFYQDNNMAFKVVGKAGNVLALVIAESETL